MQERSSILDGLGDVVGSIRRYCGLPWSGGPAETWAYHFYDAVPTAHDNVVTPVDVMVAGALHPGISRSDLTFFHEHAPDIRHWLTNVRATLSLADADDQDLSHLGDLGSFEPHVSLTLLTKVLHRKRPLLIPPLDRHVVDLLRPVTGERSATKAWPGVLGALRDELNHDKTRLMLAIADPYRELAGQAPTPLRMLDIAIWMAER